MMLPDLFATDREKIALDPGAWLLGDFALDEASALLAEIARIAAQAPFRHLETRTGGTMSVAMTNCGDAGWVSDRRGYRYTDDDPLSGQAWPAMPSQFRDLARRAAETAGFPGFAPDACLINRYAPGTRLSLHQDRDEARHDAPIVSVSLGVPARFIWGGQQRSDRPRRHNLFHGDIVVWGGPARLTFHGIDMLRKAHHPETGDLRFNLTFRRARLPNLA
ncbi:DNA oxidative demethylase AlkB [Novosphingobium sp. PS1R-30]|uniref:DNA oxidative demethylase AlkB n=1 Tax=Novosphingobium anseongense TaxID=3133436 RepID=A0ABU8RZV4_9SPHN